ncbi:hypothetical protein D9M71_497710 [compost metagenome]
MYSPFDALLTVASSSLTGRSTRSPFTNTSIEVRVRRAISPSSRYIKRLVTGKSASWSELIKFSPIPTPITNGEPSRTVISSSG